MKAIRALGVVLMALLIVGASVASASVPSGLIDEPGLTDCLDPVPEQAVVADDGKETVLDVHFVLDDFSLSQAEAAVAYMQRPFAELGIKIEATFEEVSFPTETSFEGRPSIDPIELMNLTRDYLGGYRPHGADVVYTMTGKELVSSGAIGSGVAGQADCIGGVRFPDYAFATGEALAGEERLDRRTAVIAAHEIAHLLGAHHHYANCAQGNPDEIVNNWTPCTLMFNDIALISLRMSTVEASVVRGHMLAYADNTPTGPPEPIQREVKLRATKSGFKGGIYMDDFFEECSNGVEVTIERKRGRGWRPVAYATTNTIGLFSLDTKAAGTYRAVAPETMAHDGTNWRTCPETVSRPARA